jgi:D-alanyl-D-alanine carboxypeptidase
VVGVLAVAACATGSGDATPSTPQPSARPAFADALEPLIDQKLKDNAIPGAVVLIDKGGEGRWVQSFGTARLGAEVPMGPEDHFRVGSNTKTMTATVVLQLVQEGKLRLDDPVSKYYAGVPNGDTITIAQLLEMRSGLANYTYDPAFVQQPQKTWKPEELLALSFAKPVAFAPGAEFEYSNANYILLGVVIEKVTGMAAPDVFQQRIFEPLGLTHTSLPALTDNQIADPHPQGYMFLTEAATLDEIKLTPAQQAAAFAGTLAPTDVTDWNPSPGWTAGSAISTADDMATYTKQLITGGLLDATTQQLRLDSIQPVDPTKPDGPGYGLGLARIPPNLIGHDGQIPGFVTLAAYDPDIDLLVVILTNLYETPEQKLPAVKLLTPIVDLFYHR